MEAVPAVGPPISPAISPAISIVLPVYDAAAGLAACLDLLERTVEAAPGARSAGGVELIVVDDGSADATGTIAEDFAADRPWVQVIRFPANRGVSAARNRGLAASRGRYVWFVDWDDVWEPRILERLHAEVVRADADVAVCGARWATEQGLPLGRADGAGIDRVVSGPEAFDLVLQGRIRGYLWTKLVRRSAWPQDPFAPMAFVEDLHALAPVLAHARRVALIGEVLYTHVRRSGSISNSADPPIDDILRCSARIHEVAERLPSTPERELLLLHYDYAHVRLPRIHATARITDRRAAREVLRTETSAMRLGSILRLRAVSRRSVRRLLVPKLLGPTYPGVRRVVVGARGAARGARRRLP